MNDIFYSKKYVAIRWTLILAHTYNLVPDDCLGTREVIRFDALRI